MELLILNLQAPAAVIAEVHPGFGTAAKEIYFLVMHLNHHHHRLLQVEGGVRHKVQCCALVERCWKQLPVGTSVSHEGCFRATLENMGGI